MAGGNNNDSSPGRGRGGRGRGSGRGSPGGRGGRGDNGGRGRGPGRGRGDNGGRGGGGGRGRGGPSNRQDRKANRRQKQLETMSRKAAEEDAYFRQCQREAQNNNHGNKSPKDDTSKAREDELFGKQMVKGINFEKYNQIKVEVKVPEASHKEAVPAMEDFTKLPHLNPQLQKNIQLMKYTHPTPIQKNAIPLAMAGEDLMCCAQTGSGKTCAFLLPIVAALGKQQPKKQNKGRNKKNNNKNNVNKEGDSNNNDNNNNQDSGKKAPLEPAKPKCIVLAPTRELAMQIELEAEKLTHAMPSLQPVVVYGGANPKAQLKELAYASSSSNDNDNDNHHLIVVATPGRLTDFVDRNLVSLSDVQYLVLDEADRCLDMGFEPQVRKIVQESGMTPKEQRQTFLFSATFPPAIQKLASEFLRTNYVWIAIGRVGSTTDSITQVLVKATADKRRKLELVVQALEKGPKGRTLIFVQKKRTATWLKKQLNKGGPDAPNKRGDAAANRKQQQQQQPYQGKELKFTPIAAEEIHGDRSQAQREAALEKFRAGKCKVLVATDVAARGLDIPGVEHVINMDLPTAEEEFDSYVHRIGRTGRAGNEGLATSLFVPGDNPKSENGRIASLLVKQLKECKQEVPPWLASLVLGGGGGNNNNNKGKPQFTSTDVRKNTSRPARSSNNNNSNNDSRDGNADGNNNNGKSEQQGGRGQGGSNQSGRSEGRGRGRGGRGRGGREGRARGSNNNTSSNKGDDNQQPKPDEKTAEGGGNKPTKDQSESNGNSDSNPAGRSGGRGGRGRGRGRGRGSGRGRGRKPGRDNE